MHVCMYIYVYKNSFKLNIHHKFFPLLAYETE